MPLRPVHRERGSRAFESGMIAQGGEIGIVLHPLALSPTSRGGFFQTVKRLLGLTQQSVNAGHVVQDLEFVGFHLYGVFRPLQSPLPVVELG